MRTFLGPLRETSPERLRLLNARTGAVLATRIETAFEPEARRRGLLGRDAFLDDSALIIAPCPAVHTAFMRFPIDVVFAARDGRVLKARRLSPWRLSVAWRGFAALELPAGTLVRSPLRPGDRVVLAPFA